MVVRISAAKRLQRAGSLLHECRRSNARTRLLLFRLWPSKALGFVLGMAMGARGKAGDAVNLVVSLSPSRHLRPVGSL